MKPEDYSQSARPKANVFYKSRIAAQLASNSRHDGPDPVLGKYSIFARKRQYAEFIEWFRNSYPKEYLNFFV